jgi:O-antigen/teichoic acid export membrane protein
MSEAAPRPLTGGVVMSATSRITVAITGAATTIFIARLLGPDGTGAFAIALTLITMLTAFTTLGIEHGIAYFVSSRRWNAGHAHRTAQRVALVSGAVGAAIALGLRLLFPSAFSGLTVEMTVVVLGALPFSLSWFYATYVALAIDRYEAYVLPPAVQSAIGLVMVGVLAAVWGLAGAVVGIAASHLLTAVYTKLLMRRSLPPPDESPSAGQLRRAVRFGIKGYAANALQFLNYRFDLFILAGVAAAADVGQYSVGIAVTSVMWLLPRALSDVLFPRIAALSARETQSGASERAFVEAKSMRHTVAIVLVSTIGLAGSLLLLVVPVYGEDFRPAIELGMILLPGVALLALSGTLSATFVGRGHPGYSLAITLITTPVTIGLYATLIPSLEATGAALASSISYAVTFLLAVVFYRHVVGEPVLSRFVPTRSELADYRALAPAIRTWTRAVWARRAPSRR